MSKSARLRVEDVRAIVNLVGECRDLGDDPAAWPQHLMRAVAGLTGAVVAIDADMAFRDDTPAILTASTWGWENGLDQAAQLQALAHFRDDPTLFLATTRYADRFRAGDTDAYRRTDTVGDREWEASAERQVYRQMGVDHMIASYRWLPGAGGRFRALCLSRPVGERDFTRRDCVLIREVLTAVAPLVGGPLARPGEPSPAGLPPRVRQVLRGLLRGDGDKQIAARLGVTRHTVNQYAKAIFRHFGVQTRAELLARWVRRGFPGGFGWGSGGGG